MACCYYRKNKRRAKRDTVIHPPPSVSFRLSNHPLSMTRLPLLLFYFCLLSFPLHGPVMVEAFTGTYGINYGRIADNIPPPESVVTLLKAAKIKNVKIYDSDHSVITAFKGSGLELTIGITNGEVKDISASETRAMDWLKENVQPFFPGTKISGIAVGNEILGGDPGLAEALLGAMQNVYNALKALQLDDQILVTSPHSQAVFANSYPPSACTFSESVMAYMKPILDFCTNISSPFYVNVYPFIAYKSDPEHIDVNYALFKSNPGIYDAKTNLHYDNMFEAQVDAAYAALDAAGYNNMEVVVSETGWASSGDADEAGASVENARAYNFNLKKLLFKRKGTPLKPKMVLKAYIFALFNENLKNGPSSERHYGLFNADGSISYNIGFTGLKPSAAGSSAFLSFKVFVAMQSTYIFWSLLVEGRPRATIASLFMFTCRGILGSTTQLPLPKEFLGSGADFPVGNVSFFLFFSGHVAGSMIASLDMRRVKRYKMAWSFDALNILQAIRLLASRGHYTIDLATGLGAGFLFDIFAGHYLESKNQKRHNAEEDSLFGRCCCNCKETQHMVAGT